METVTLERWRQRCSRAFAFASSLFVLRPIEVRRRVRVGPTPAFGFAGDAVSVALLGSLRRAASAGAIPSIAASTFLDRPRQQI